MWHMDLKSLWSCLWFGESLEQWHRGVLGRGGKKSIELWWTCSHLWQHCWLIRTVGDCVYWEGPKESLLTNALGNDKTVYMIFFTAQKLAFAFMTVFWGGWGSVHWPKFSLLKWPSEMVSRTLPAFPTNLWLEIGQCCPAFHVEVLCAGMTDTHSTSKRKQWQHSSSKEASTFLQNLRCHLVLRQNCGEDLLGCSLCELVGLTQKPELVNPCWIWAEQAFLVRSETILL